METLLDSIGIADSEQIKSCLNCSIHSKIDIKFSDKLVNDVKICLNEITK